MKVQLCFLFTCSIPLWSIQELPLPPLVHSHCQHLPPYLLQLKPSFLHLYLVLVLPIICKSHVTQDHQKVQNSHETPMFEQVYRNKDRYVACSLSELCTCYQLRCRGSTELGRCSCAPATFPRPMTSRDCNIRHSEVIFSRMVTVILFTCEHCCFW